ncbi:MAG: deoxynucleoside kinase [Oscillospiraceae bacterium]|nr:deoxynucleoside kinase [Oscillospiraceae bacterium]
MPKGKLIVLEGIDGSGKSSQYRRLCARMENDGIDYNHIVFPRYDKESSALIRMYLKGEFGEKPSDVSAYAASTFYAVDRYASYCSDWGKIYENGGLIISDRYTTSNAVHQGSKLDNDELPEFFDWLADLEYVKMGLPKPDLVIYLDVDIETSLRRMAKRQETTSTTADIHEKDVAYLSRCLEVAGIACEHFGWMRIPYLKDGLEREVDEKNAQIYEIVKNYISPT